jgi:predicted histidine transporter YuiF (NhaC family)
MTVILNARHIFLIRWTGLKVDAMLTGMRATLLYKCIFSFLNPSYYFHFVQIILEHVTNISNVLRILVGKRSCLWRSQESLVLLHYKQDRQWTYKRHIEMRSRNHSCHGKIISVTYSECVSVALVIQHAKRMRRMVLSNVAGLAVPYFSTLSHKFYDFRKNVIERKMWVLIFSKNCVWNISHSKKNSARCYNKCAQVLL